MDDLTIANERQDKAAETERTLRLLRLRFLQLWHTNDQLLAGLHDLATRGPAPDDSAAPPGDRRR